jgi:hypothetical protein
MPAAKAKRPASPKAGSSAPAKRATRLREPSRAAARTTTRPSAAEAFDGPGYQFVGFRFMCRHRHVRH